MNKIYAKNFNKTQIKKEIFREDETLKERWYSHPLTRENELYIYEYFDEQQIINKDTNVAFVSKQMSGGKIKIMLFEMTKEEIALIEKKFIDGDIEKTIEQFLGEAKC